MFDPLTRGALIQVWLDEADRADAELVRSIEETERSAPKDASLPSDLAALEPGIALAAVLAKINIDALSGHDRVTVMAAHQRMASHYQAQVYASMASVADAVTEEMHKHGETDFELVEDACSAEIRAALQLTRRAADNELSIARDFKTRLPAVWQEFVSGRLDRRRANLILHRTDHLPTAQAREVARRALERAPELTTGQLGALLRKLGIEADPEDSRHRYETAVEERRVVLESGIDGTAHLLLLDLPPDRAARIRERIDAAARRLRTKTDTRTMDQLRADVALDLLDPEAGQRSRSGRGALVMTVDLATLAGLADSSGDLGGYGPVIADVARQVAKTSQHDEWRFVLTDSEGRPLHVGLTRRRPTSTQRRLVETLYPTCVFPGCRVPASRCDLDHITPWVESGRTSVAELAPGCRHDHVLRHRAGWTYCRNGDGDHEWTSPLGHRYVKQARPP